MKNGKIRTRDACLIAGLDRYALTECVAAGQFLHTPKARRGTYAIYSANDIVPLRIFADLLQFGFTRRRAGSLVGQILKTGDAFDKSKTIKLKFDLAKITDEINRALGNRTTPSGHTVNCDFHCDQVPGECTCGASASK